MRNGLQGVPCCKYWLEGTLNWGRNVMNKRAGLPEEFSNHDTCPCPGGQGQPHPCHPNVNLCQDWLCTGECAFTAKGAAAAGPDVDPDIAGICRYIHPKELRGCLGPYLQSDIALHAAEIAEEAERAVQEKLKAFKDSASWPDMPAVRVRVPVTSVCRPCIITTAVTLVAVEVKDADAEFAESHPDVYAAWQKDTGGWTWRQFLNWWKKKNTEWNHPFYKENVKDGKKGFLPQQAPPPLSDVYGVPTEVNGMAPFWDFFYGREPSPSSYVVVAVPSVPTPYEPLPELTDEAIATSMELHTRVEKAAKAAMKEAKKTAKALKAEKKAEMKDHKAGLRSERSRMEKREKRELTTPLFIPPKGEGKRHKKTKWGMKTGEPHVVKRSEEIQAQIAAQMVAELEARRLAKAARKPNRAALVLESEEDAGKAVVVAKAVVPAPATTPVATTAAPDAAADSDSDSE